MRLGYNTNGFAHHDPVRAVELLSEWGYRSVALTIDHQLLNPFAISWMDEAAEWRRRLERLEMTSVIETGARFLLDPRAEHEPTLMSADPAARARRIDFLRRALDVARELGSDCVSLWSGRIPDEVRLDAARTEEAFQRLASGLREVLDHAERRQVTIGFEPEPGMFIDTMGRWDELLTRIDAPHLQLTLDIGHLHCQGETPIPDFIERYGSRLVNVHLEDMRAGVHEHLMFGEGELDFPPIIDALAKVGYEGGVHVELSRHSHEAPAAALRAFEFLAPMVSKYQA